MEPILRFAAIKNKKMVPVSLVVTSVTSVVKKHFSPGKPVSKESLVALTNIVKVLRRTGPSMTGKEAKDIISELAKETKKLEV